MTARCNGGTSSAIPSNGGAAVIGGGAISLAIEALAPYMAPLALLVDGFIYEATAQCSSDPPPMPTFDAGDMLTVALGQESPNFQSTISKIDNLLLNYAWDKFCRCDSGGFQPTQPVPPPAGTSAPSGTSSSPCFQGAYEGQPVQLASSAPVNTWEDFTLPMLGSNGSSRTIHFSDGSTGPGYGMPTGTTSISYTGSGPMGTGFGFSGGLVEFGINFADANGVLTGQAPMGLPTSVGSNLAGTIAIPANTAFWAARVSNRASNFGAYTAPMVLQTNVWCGGGGPGVFLNCCPPDPGIQLALNNILTLLNQRAQTLPPAYVKGTVHSGLTGSGTITVSGLFGLSIHLTTGVPTAIEFPGVPPYERSVGWLSILTGDGLIDETRLTREHQVWASALAPYATTFGYQLNAGFTADITELQPAPAPARF